MTGYDPIGFDPSDVAAIAGSTAPAPPAPGPAPAIGPDPGNPRNALARAALGAGLTSVANNWSKPALAAFAGGAGAALQGQGQAESQIDQQALAWQQAQARIINDNLNLMIKAHAEGDMNAWRQAQLGLLQAAHARNPSSSLPPGAAPSAGVPLPAPRPAAAPPAAVIPMAPGAAAAPPRAGAAVPSALGLAPPGVGAAPARVVDTGPQAPPAVGEVRRGYRFMGGDPARPDSWERVE